MAESAEVELPVQAPGERVPLAWAWGSSSEELTAASDLRSNLSTEGTLSSAIVKAQVSRNMSPQLEDGVATVPWSGEVWWQGCHSGMLTPGANVASPLGSCEPSTRRTPERILPREPGAGHTGVSNLSSSSAQSAVFGSVLCQEITPLTHPSVSPTMPQPPRKLLRPLLS